MRGRLWNAVVSVTLSDVRHAIRRLRRAPGFTVLCALTLAVGIGTSTAIISAVNPILFEPLPYPQPEHIVSIWDHGVDASHLDVTFGTFREISERNRTLDSIAVMRAWQPTVTGSEEPERLEGQRVTAKYFDVLAMSPMLGRTFTSIEDLPNGPKVAILSDRLWQRRFSGDSNIIGRDITLDDDHFTVIGIMPPAFENVLSPSAELWTTLQYNPALPLDGREWGHHLRMIARVRADGRSVAAAAAELEAIARNRIPEFARAPWAALGQGLIVSPLKEDVVTAVKPALLAILAAVVLMLLIACVNVTNLMLARGAQRKGEFAVRAALGAGRSRMIRHLLTESLLLTGFGGALGMIVADLGLRLFVAVAPSTLPRATAMEVDSVTLAFGVAITIVVGVAVGVIPAFRASATRLSSSLQFGSTRVAGDHQSIRRVLVIAEVALAIVLLVSAGLLMRSVQRLFAISPGFEAAHLLTMQVQTSGHRFDKVATDRFYRQALESVRRVPGVTAAAFTSQLPLSGDVSEYGVLFENPDLNVQGGQPAFRYAVSPGYIETIGIPLRRGRLLEPRDDATGPRVALVSESLARKIGADAIGSRIRVGWSTGMPYYTIVGVVGDVKQASLSTQRADAVYTTPEQWSFADNPMSLVIRTRDRAATLTPEIRRAIWSVDKDQPIMRIAMMDTLIATSAAERRFALILFQAFSVIALLLAAIGIYGVLATSVTERTREIGVRSALGATRGAILRLILRQGLSLIVVGAIVGVAGGLGASRGLATLLFNTSRFDPLTYTGVVTLLGSVALLACWIPASRAARVDPAVALRS